jgi:hypothetical protein
VLETAPDAAGTITEPADDLTATRPVRMLVPSDRRGRLFLSERDTLMASDLGITRATTDAQLAVIAEQYDPGRANVLGQVRQLRDGLAQPRDLGEAKAWGLHIPVTDHENGEELGWWWVYDLQRRETRIQRRTRYQLDHRRVDTKGMARVWCRSYLSVKDIKIASARAREVLANEGGARDNIVDGYMFAGRLDRDAVEREVIAGAQKVLSKGTPEPVDRAGQSDLFDVWETLRAGRLRKALDEWYEFSRISQTGRPVGAKTRNKTPRAVS